MGRRAQLVVVVFLLVITGRGLSATTSPIASVHLTEGWATFGQAVPQGMVPDGSGLQVGSLPTQTDVKNRWPDGSIRFAIVTAKVSIADQYSITSAASFGGTFVPAVQIASVLLNISSCTPEHFVCQTGVHVAQLSASESEPWLSGPLVHEARSVVRPASPIGEPHPYLRVNFDTRVYNDGASRVDVSVENMLNTSDARTVGYDVTVMVAGTTAFIKSNVEHHYLTRWRKVFSSAQFSTITPDLTPFNLSRALPPYLSIVVDQVDEPTSPDYDILGSGALDHNMPAHSGRQELAPYPDWTARYLVHKNPLQRQFVLVNGDLSGGWPIHAREAEADVYADAQPGVGPEERMVSLDQRPFVWYDRRAGSIERPDLDYLRGLPLPIGEYGELEPEPGSGQSRLIPDNAHQPSIAYVPYLLTGDRYYAEEMAFWANYSMMRIDPGNPGEGLSRGSEGILENQETRGYAWALRNLADAAAYYPDSSPVRAYLSERVTANLQWLDNYANEKAADPGNPLKILWIGYRPEAGFISMWEQNYLAYAIDRANKQGFVGGLYHRDLIVGLQLKLFGSEPEYPRYTILTDDYCVGQNPDEGPPAVCRDGAGNEYPHATILPPGTVLTLGEVMPAGTRMDWSAPYLLNVATADHDNPWLNVEFFPDIAAVAAGTTQGPFFIDRFRPYEGYYGPEARLNLMIAKENAETDPVAWAGATDAYDYLFDFIGVADSACGNIANGEDRPDLACRAGWALDEYPPYTPPSGGGGDEDDDDDGVNDDIDNCPAVPNPDQLNTDGDASGDACDTDDDNDGTLDAADAFPLDETESVDTDNDGIGNNADPDDDNDLALDAADRFPLDPAESVDTDNDGIGNNADPDDDNDLVLDAADRFPLDRAESVDTDNDGIGNNADPNDDNDGRPDTSDPRPLIPNVAPEVTTTAAPPATVGVLVTLSLNATDADGDGLTYTATGLPGGLTLPPGTKVISGTPNAPGTFTVKVTASDGLLSNFKTFTWVVNDTPDDPIVLVNPGSQTSTEDEWVRLKLTWSSTVMKPRGRRSDPRPVHFTASGLPRALHIHQDGTISGRVGKKAARERDYHVTVTLRVGKQRVSQQFTWTILDANRAPRLRHIDDQSSKVGSSPRLEAHASDPDGDRLTFTVAGLPPGLKMSSEGEISGTVGGGAKEYHVTVTVSDGRLSERETFHWNVTAVKGKEEKGKK